MTRKPSASESARLLRQRVEMGGAEIFLDGMTREEALRLVEAAGREAGSEMPASSPGPGPQAASSREPSPKDDTARTTSGGVPPEAAVSALDSGASAPRSTALPDGYDELRKVALECTSCRLCESRTQVVFSDGQVDARIMVVGEAPGANEDATGLPFVGAAGKYLDLLLATVDLSRAESVYIANVLKCRPPGNRDPLPDEIEACSPFLLKQIELIQPQALLAVGSFAARLLTGREKSALGKLRGEVHAYHGVPLIVTYHPAALLRNPNWTRLFWDDLQLLRSVIDET